jgi:hypothetical protein
MAIKITASDVQEVFNYFTKQCPGSSIEVSIDPTEQRLLIKTSNKKSEVVNITVFAEGIGSFPKLTKDMRLGDDV